MEAAGYKGAMVNYIQYSPATVAAAKGAYVYLQFAPYESASTNPAVATLIKRVKAIAPNAPLTQGIEAGYFAADQFIAALKKTGKNLTAESFQKAADSMTYQIKNTVGPTTLPPWADGADVVREHGDQQRQPRGRCRTPTCAPKPCTTPAADSSAVPAGRAACRGWDRGSVTAGRSGPARHDAYAVGDLPRRDASRGAWVTVFLNIVISGAVAGAIYSMMASALVLTYQTSGVFNFAQGAVAFVSAFFYFQLHTGQHLSIVVSALITVFGFAPLLGLLLDRVLFRRLAEGPVFARIVGTIGLLVALPAIALWTVETVCNGVFNMNLPETTAIVAAGGSVPGVGPTPPTVWHLGAIDLPKVNVNSDQLAVLAAAAIVAVLLWLLLRHTRIGLEMRAAVDKKELSGLRGMNVARTSGLSWVLTMMISSLAGILIAPLFQLDPNTLTLVVLGSLVAVAVAGLRSIPIAMAGRSGPGHHPGPDRLLRQGLPPEHPHPALGLQLRRSLSS